MDIIKNPIILGTIAGVFSYLFLNWKDKNKKEDEKTSNKYNILISIIVAVIIIFVTYFFFNKNSTDENLQQIGGENVVKLIDNPLENKNIQEMSENLTHSFDNKGYHLISKNAKKLPQLDVHIDLAKF